MACEIQNAYLTADCRQKIWTVAGPEFGSEAGTIFIVKKALYGLKSAGAALRSLLADTSINLGYRLTKADLDVWFRPAVKPDGFEYDILSISHDPEATLRSLTGIFEHKDNKLNNQRCTLEHSLER